MGRRAMVTIWLNAPASTRRNLIFLSSFLSEYATVSSKSIHREPMKLAGIDTCAKMQSRLVTTCQQLRREAKKGPKRSIGDGSSRGRIARRVSPSVSVQAR